MEHTPKPGEIYRHFKNRLYQVIAVARHTETEEELVVYQALYGTYGVYARPLAGFTGKVDRKKYPDAAQAFRFELVDVSGLAEAEEKESRTKASQSDKTGEDQKESGGPDKTGDAGKDITVPAGEEALEQALNPLLLSFVDTRDFDVKLEILSAMEDRVGQDDVDALCEALDLPKMTGDIGGQVRSVRQYLEMRKKFDNKRLR